MTTESLNTRTKYAIFTIDAEDFGDTGCIKQSGADMSGHRMLDGLDTYIALLEKHGAKATVFTVCSTAHAVADKLKNYASRGHEIALHGLEHINPAELSNEEFSRSVSEAKREIEDELGVKIVGYRAPFFGLDGSKLEIIKNAGFLYDSSRLDVSKHHTSGHIALEGFKKITEGIWKSGSFFEFGIPAQSIFGLFKFPISGGGYVRLGNWGFVKTAIKRFIGRSDYYVFYLHPFELSKEKVLIPEGLRGLDRYYLSHGFDSFEKRIEIIITLLEKAGFEFTTFAELMKKNDN